MSSHLWPTIQTAKVNCSWFRPLQPGRYAYFVVIFILCFSCAVREELGLTKFEEILEQERRRYVDKGFF